MGRAHDPGPVSSAFRIDRRRGRPARRVRRRRLDGPEILSLDDMARAHGSAWSIVARYMEPAPGAHTAPDRLRPYLRVADRASCATAAAAAPRCATTCPRCSRKPTSSPRATAISAVRSGAAVGDSGRITSERFDRRCPNSAAGCGVHLGQARPACRHAPPPTCCRRRKAGRPRRWLAGQPEHEAGRSPLDGPTVHLSNAWSPAFSIPVAQEPPGVRSARAEADAQRWNDLFARLLVDAKACRVA